MGRRLTAKAYFERVYATHGNRYDYSKSEYKNLSTKIVITCRLHGDFEQRADMHAKGQGCPVCAHKDRAETCVQRYGIAQPMNTEYNRRKAHDTVVTKYGVDNLFQSPVIKERIAHTNMERYGVANPMQNDSIKEKAVQTNLIRYGCPCSMQNEVVREHHRMSMMQKYGVEYSTQIPFVQEKIKQTCIERYGVENPRQSDEVASKMIHTTMLKYGVPYVVQSPIIRSNIQNTIRDKYGVDNVMQCSRISERAKNTCIGRYGTPNPMQNPEICAKAFDTRRKNHTFNTSVPEDILYEMLCRSFGFSDVIRQYKSSVYPFACDFYIISRDMYIELNASWAHGGHWFDPKLDVDKFNMWVERAKMSKYYENSLHTWSVSDVNKRNLAQQHGLCYVVFWRNDLSDAYGWFAEGCPDRYDWI